MVRRHLWVFHGFIAVAPLKHADRARKDMILAVFHGFIAVAPLKLERQRCSSARPSLPRLHRRGPIEAGS